MCVCVCVCGDISDGSTCQWLNPADVSCHAHTAAPADMRGLKQMHCMWRRRVQSRCMSRYRHHNTRTLQVIVPLEILRAQTDAAVRRQTHKVSVANKDLCSLFSSISHFRWNSKLRKVLPAFLQKKQNNLRRLKSKYSFAYSLLIIFFSPFKTWVEVILGWAEVRQSSKKFPHWTDSCWNHFSHPDT